MCVRYLNVWARQLQVEVNESFQLFIDVVYSKNYLWGLLLLTVLGIHISDFGGCISLRPALNRSSGYIRSNVVLRASSIYGLVFDELAVEQLVLLISR